MNQLFKEIRHNNIEAVRAAISKNSAVVNEVYNAKAPKKDIGQSPLQVAIKCGAFEIIELLLENGADADFIEDIALVPPHSVCMPVLHDAIIGVFPHCAISSTAIPKSTSIWFRHYSSAEPIRIEKHRQNCFQSVRR